MLTTNNMLSQLPSFIAGDPYVKELLTSKNREVNLIDEVQADILKQFNVDTATWGLSWWERSLGIANNGYIPSYYIQESDPTIKYFGEWQRVDLRDEDSKFSNDLNGIVMRADSTKKNWFEFKFYGTGFKMYKSSVSTESFGFEILIDGVKYTENYLDHQSKVYETVFFEKIDLNAGYHTIRFTLFPYNADPYAKYERCSFDKVLILDTSADDYDRRRTIIKSRLMPITSVTNKTILDLAKLYGFEIKINEEDTYVYSLTFPQNSNVDTGLRKQLLLDLNNIMPSHILLKNKFFVSTFYDIREHAITWDEMNLLFTFEDFLANNKPDVFDKYRYMTKYLLQSKFHIDKFNYDYETVDRLKDELIVNNLHDDIESDNRVIDGNLVWSSSLGFSNTSDINSQFKTLNTMLLTDKKRNKLTTITNGRSYDNESIDLVINNFVDSKNKLSKSTKNHAAMNSGATVDNSFVDIVDSTANLTNVSLDTATTGDLPQYLVKGKVAYKKTYNGLEKVVGTMGTYSPSEFYNNIYKYPNGTSINNICLERDYVVAKEPELKAENIQKGKVIFGVTGTLTTVDSTYNKGDTLFEWQIENLGESYKIIG